MQGNESPLSYAQAHMINVPIYDNTLPYVAKY